jgi:hypothetical protein
MTRCLWAPIGGLRRRGTLTLSIMLVVVALLSGCSAAGSAGRAGRTSAPVAAVAAPGKPYTCAPGAGQSIYGTFGDASAIGSVDPRLPLSVTVTVGVSIGETGPFERP